MHPGPYGDAVERSREPKEKGRRSAGSGIMRPSTVAHRIIKAQAALLSCGGVLVSRAHPTAGEVAAWLNTPGDLRGVVVLLDPPYAGFDELYGTAPVSERVRAWCVANGARPDLRIALCGYAGEHDELEALGWRVEAWKATGGYANQSDGENENATKERIWFSPACLSVEPVIDKPAEKTIKQQGFVW
jgi:hypothetical protein